MASSSAAEERPADAQTVADAVDSVASAADNDVSQEEQEMYASGARSEPVASDKQPESAKAAPPQRLYRNIPGRPGRNTTATGPKRKKEENANKSSEPNSKEATPIAPEPVPVPVPAQAAEAGPSNEIGRAHV